MTDTVVSLAKRDDGLPRKLSGEECLALVRELEAQGGRVVFRQHALDRMEEREVTATQVFAVLRRGELVNGPDWSASHQNWTFTIRADSAGQLVSVGGAIDVDLMGLAVVIITVFC